MDCEKFDTHVIDALYDELDEVTHAAIKRHAETCARCSGVLSGLRATREVGVLPIEEPSDDLEDRILEAAAAAQRKAPWHKKVIRGIAWAGSHAMRPQLAMAAVLVLILGSSVLLLRPKPGTDGAAPVRVTERGVPEPEREEQLAEVAAATAAPAAVAQAAPTTASLDDSPPVGGAGDERKRGLAKEDGVALAEGAKDKAKTPADSKEAAEALNEARAAKVRSGCDIAVMRYDDVGARFPGSRSAAIAMWEAAECYKSMGKGDKAQQLYLALKENDEYRQQAEKEIASSDNNVNAYGNSQQAPGGGHPAAAAAARAAAPAPAKASKVAAEGNAGSTPPAAAPAPPAPPPTSQGGSGSSAGKKAAPDRSDSGF